MKDIQKSSLDLLETIWFAVGCTYLSDLRSPYFFPVILKALNEIDPASYDLRKWMDAVFYITGKTVPIKTAKEALRYLKDYLTVK